MFGKSNQRRLIPPEFTALAFELQYHGLAVRINSGNDGATLCTNLVKFCPVTPETRAHLHIYVPVLGENRPNTCLRRAAIQKCHRVLDKPTLITLSVNQVALTVPSHKKMIQKISRGLRDVQWHSLSRNKLRDIPLAPMASPTSSERSQGVTRVCS